MAKRGISPAKGSARRTRMGPVNTTAPAKTPQTGSTRKPLTVPSEK